MATLGEAFQALGTGFATAAEDREERMRKLMREQQRRQLLTAALTPVATGVSKAVTDLISEPFKQSATNYFRGTEGGEYKTDLVRRNSLEAGARARDKKIQEQGLVPYYAESLKKNGGDAAFENWTKETYGSKDPTTFSSYHDTRAAYDAFILERAALEGKEHEDLMNFLNRTTLTAEEEKALIKKYSPAAQGLGQGLFRFGSRKIRGLTKKEDRAERLLTLRKKTGLTSEIIDEMERLNKLGSEYGFSREVLDAIPELNTDQVKRDAQVYAESLKLRDKVRDMPVYFQNIYASEEKRLGKGYLTTAQLERAVSENILKVTKTSLEDEQQSFVDRHTRGKTLDNNILLFLEGSKNLTPAQQKTEIKEHVTTAYRLSKSWVDAQIGSGTLKAEVFDPTAVNVEQQYASLVRQRADYLINNQSQFVEEETLQKERTLGVFNPLSWIYGGTKDVTIKNPRLAITEEYASAGGDVSATTPTTTAPAAAAGAGAGAGATVTASKIQALTYDLSSPKNTDIAARWSAAWKQAQRQDDPLAAWDEAKELLTNEIISTLPDSNSVELMVTNLPFQSEIDALRNPVTEATVGTDAARFYDRELSRFRRGESTGPIVPGRGLDSIIEGLESLGFKNDLAEQLSLERMAKGFTPLQAVTEPLAILIDSIIPEAEAAPVEQQESDSLLSGTSVSRYVDRQTQREQDIFARKGTIEVSVGNKTVNVDTADPVSFLRDRFGRQRNDPEALTFGEGVIAYKEAIEKHNQGRRNTTYALDPVYNSILYSMEADGRYSPDRLNNMADERERSKEEGIDLKAKIEARMEEVERYKNIVSDMTDAQKEQEFKKQLQKSREQPISSDEGLINNAIEFLKLQSIFGENSNRDISRKNEEPVTVNDKVTQYYDYLDLYEDDDYDKHTNLYRRLAVGLSSGQQPTSLLAQL